MDISALRERGGGSEWTVSELNAYIKRALDNDRNLSAVTLRGEISNFTYHRSGHLYFSLKDEGGQVKAVMFRSSAAALRFMPENGMKVIVRCSVSVYVQTGSYQIYVTSMQPDGVGALYLAYEQLKQRLADEGLFDEEHKLPIPIYPSRVGVITSPTGAAVRDIINVTGRRFPAATVYLYPSLVQGDGAEPNLIAALDYLEKSGLVDVIIIGRGGGSIEDLWAFNGEALARRIYECKVPVISAVGHETDFTICDFVSDLRAPTPSAAAEIAVPDAKDILLRLDTAYDRCVQALVRKAERAEERLIRIKESDLFAAPETFFDTHLDDLRQLKDSLTDAIKLDMEKSETALALIAGKLQALSPLTTLARGYSVASGVNGTLKSTDDIEIGQNMTVRVTDGEIIATVNSKRRLNNG
jgi:exodeoxyribonuclease VII large subunit